ncbi:MAG: type IV pilin N-terminal domain-containing protein [Methanoregulaceae archaeon]
MKMFTTDEEAVSPVIGVILMVAIVVILAAVIAAFVFGMAGSTGTSKNVGMTVTLNNSVSGDEGLDLLWQGGTDINSLQSISATINGEDKTIINPTFAVGQITTINNESPVVSSRVIIVGTFTDGSEQVLFDRRY